jgi:hypothetical protein
MASISQLTARLIDLFGSPATANPSKLAGNLTVSPNGNILVGQTTDNGTDKLQVTGSARITNTPLYMAGPAATYRDIVYQSGTSYRWVVGADNGTETGSNAGSNWFMNRYNDAGTFIDAPFSISRASGVVNIPNGLTTGGLTVNSAGSIFTSDTTDTTGMFRTTGDIGGSFSSWNASRAFAVQVDAPNYANAYGGIRWTRWGGRHLAAIEAYEGGSGSSQPTIVMHMSNQNNAWTFSNTDITRGAGGTVYGTWNLNPVLAGGGTGYGAYSMSSVHVNTVGAYESNQGLQMSWNDDGSSGNSYLCNNQGGGTGGLILRTVNSNNTVELGRFVITAAGAGSQGSDIRLKDNVETIQNALERIRSIRGVSYTYKANGEKHYGVIAQEVKPVFPDAVMYTHFGENDPSHHDTDDLMGVHYNDLVGPLIEAIKELADKVDAQAEQIEELKAKING